MCFVRVERCLCVATRTRDSRHLRFVDANDLAASSLSRLAAQQIRTAQFSPASCETPCVLSVCVRSGVFRWLLERGTLGACALCACMRLEYRICLGSETINLPQKVVHLFRKLSVSISRVQSTDLHDTVGSDVTTSYNLRDLPNSLPSAAIYHHLLCRW